MKMKNLLFLAMLTLLSVLCISCEKESWEELKWSEKRLTVDWEKGTYNITVNAYHKTDWEISFSNPNDWCTVSHQQGKGRQDITLNFDENTTNENRLVDIYVTSLNDGRRDELWIVQQENPLSLELSPTTFFQDASAANCSIVVSSTLDWTAEIEYVPADLWENLPWCTLNTTSGTRNGIIVVNLKENPTEFKRAAIITVRSGDIIKKDTIFQSAKTLSDEVGVEINGVTWATRNVGAFGTFASNHFDDYGKYYQFNYPIGFPSTNPNYLVVRRPSEFGYFEFDWDLANDPSPEGWRIPTIDEMDALYQSGHRWVDKEDSGYSYAGAWLGPNAENATKENPGEAVFFPALGVFTTNNALHSEYLLDYGFYFVTGRVGSFSNQALCIHKSEMASPRNIGFGRSTATTLRSVKK